MSIAFHGTPIIPVTRNGRAARSIRDSITRPCEDKAIPVLGRRCYSEVARQNPDFKFLPVSMQEEQSEQFFGAAIRQ